MSILGPWILQSFLGKDTTFGDDRHLTNRILSLGYRTGYNHLAICESDTPAGYVRWVKQQTRWSKSFFREAFWFPKSFAFQEFWLTVETTKQFMYPMILTATVLKMIYSPRNWIYPVLWVSTLFGVAFIKSTYGVICMRDPQYFLFGIYGFMVSVSLTSVRSCSNSQHAVLFRSLTFQVVCRIHRRYHNVGYFCEVQVRSQKTGKFLFSYHPYWTVSYSLLCFNLGHRLIHMSVLLHGTLHSLSDSRTSWPPFSRCRTCG